MVKMNQLTPVNSESKRAQSGSAVLQTKCACGSAKTSDSEQCENCQSRRAGGGIAIGASDSSFEKEADLIAEKVVNGSGAASMKPANRGLQRFSGEPAATAGRAPESVERVVSQSGEPLSQDVRSKMQRKFDWNFSNVRVHTDAQAAGSANEVRARAYTVGNHIAFAAGQYRPASKTGQRLLAHELTHVIQQSSRSASKGSVNTRGGASSTEDGLQTRDSGSSRLLSRALSGAVLQRDFAIEPPRPDAEANVLTEDQILEAIEFNNRVVTPIGVDGIGQLRDVLGISAAPAVIDEDFVNAVVRWQAVQRLSQDGKLGPRTARPLFREIGAEGIGRGELVSGPTYAPTGTIAPPVVAGQQRANFRMRAEFRHDPANNVYASCCEVRQFIRWDAASAAAMPGGIPHGGFPAGTAANTWIEDRDAANNRYGHRSGRHSDPQNFDQYIDTAGRRNQAFGHRFRGSDSPGGPAAILAGSWRFRLQVIDVCNGRQTIGTRDFVRVNW